MEHNQTVRMLAGLPGSGKTTLALALAGALGWVSIDKDTIKSAPLSSGVAEAIAGPASNRLMQALAVDLVLRQGRSVILDSPGVYPLTLDLAANLCDRSGARLKVIVLLAGRELRNERALSRVSVASQPRPRASRTRTTAGPLRPPPPR